MRGDKDVIKTGHSPFYDAANPLAARSHSFPAPNIIMYNISLMCRGRRREASTQEHQKGQILAIKLNERLLLIHHLCKVRQQPTYHVYEN